MTDYSDEDIKTIINKYEKSKKYRADYYRNRYRDDPIFREKHKQKSKISYEKRRNVIKKQYESTKELKLFKLNYKYNKKVNKLDRFMNKYPELYEKYKDHIEED